VSASAYLETLSKEGCGLPQNRFRRTGFFSVHASRAGFVSRVSPIGACRELKEARHAPCLVFAYKEFRGLLTDIAGTGHYDGRGHQRDERAFERVASLVTGLMAATLALPPTAGTRCAASGI
jgi:hypothetical protein